MRSLLSAILLSVLSFVGSASAEPQAATDESSKTVPEISQYQHMASAGTFELTPSLGYLSEHSSGNASAGGNDASGTGIPVGLYFEYGINETISVATSLNYTNATFKVSSFSVHEKGLANPILSLNGRLPTASGLFRYGANLSITLSDHTQSSNGDQNADSGGNTLTPYIGFETSSGPNLFGGQISYDAFVGEKITKQTQALGAQTTTKAKGGAATTVAVFFERTLESSLKLGGAFVVTQQESSQNITNGASADNSDQQNTTTLIAYLPYKINNLTLLPTLAYFTTNYGSSDYSQSSNAGWLFIVGARFSL